MPSPVSTRVPHTEGSPPTAPVEFLTRLITIVGFLLVAGVAALEAQTPIRDSAAARTLKPDAATPSGAVSAQAPAIGTKEGSSLKVQAAPSVKTSATTPTNVTSEGQFVPGSVVDFNAPQLVPGDAAAAAAAQGGATPVPVTPGASTPKTGRP